MKKLAFQLLSTALLLGTLASHTLAQQPVAPVCGTDEYTLARFGNPNFFEDRLLQEQLMPVVARKTDTYPGTGSRSRFVIPCVVHVFHNGGDDSVSYAQVASQFWASFRDLRRIPGTIGWGGEGVSADAEIEFALATKDPSGNPTTGVNYVRNATLVDLQQQTENAAIKAAAFWPRNKYLNFYLVNRITSTGAFPNLAGYAEFPTTSPSSTDGIVQINSTWGEGLGTAAGPNDNGRVGTHEIGHWINLFHTFQGSCGTTQCQSSGDGVCDTRPTADPNSGVTNERLNTCNQDSPDNLDNQRNYMDYSQDFVHNSITPGQVARAQSAMNNPAFIQRFPLWQESNLEQTGTGKWGPPRAYFVADRTVACTRSEIQLTDYSMNLPTRYRWLIPGADFLSADTVGSPRILFEQAGTYDVTLIVGNLNDSGWTDTLTRTGYITVRDSVHSVPFSEGFENGSALPVDWVLEDLDAAKASGKITYAVRRSFATPLGGFGQSPASIYMQNYFYADQFQLDRLQTPPLNFATSSQARLSFSLAYRPLIVPTGTQDAPNVLFQTTLTDTLRVLVSADCGQSWQLVYNKGGMSLNTAGTVTPGLTEFLPTASQWRSDTVDLTPYVPASRLQVRFEAKNGYGNNLWLDDIRVDTLPYIPTAIAPEADALSQIRLQPNPSSGPVTLALQLNRAQELGLRVVDLQGRTLWSQAPQRYAPGAHEQTLALEALPTGLYLLVLEGPGLYRSERLLRQR